jgi:hypothetical protein
MTSTLRYIFNSAISQGPSESIKEQMEMNTYDVVTLKLSPGQAKEIQILPDSNTGIKFFCITSDVYSSDGITDPNTAEMVYTIGVGTPQEKTIILDRAHVLIGKSLLDKMGNFSKLKIKNGTSSTEAPDANIKVLVGRDV